MVVKVRQLRDGTRRLDLDGEPWVDEFAGLFEMKGCQGILIGAPDGPPVPNVDFLIDLPGLRSVSFLRGVKDCSAVARVPGITSLSLATDYRGPLSLAGLTALTNLEMPYLPAVSDLAALTKLRSLFLYFWPKESTSFELLGDKPDLDYLRVQFKRTARVSTQGLAGAPNLTRLWLYDGRLTDLVGLTHLPRVTHLMLDCTKIDSLGFVEHMPNLRILDLSNCGEIDSLAPVRRHPKLDSIAIAGRTVVADGDLSPLLDLPAATSVAVERRAPHYSHLLKEVRRAP